MSGLKYIENYPVGGAKRKKNEESLQELQKTNTFCIMGILEGEEKKRKGHKVYLKQ